MWAWAHVFGGSELSLRLASSLGFCAALLILFQLLRRAFGTFPAGFATLAWCTASTLVMKENAEARSYGLFVLELALAIAAYHALLTAPILTKKTAAANIAIHALLILTHYLAIFYGVAFCAAALAHELLTGRRRLRRILCIPAGYLAILPWLPIYFHHTEFTHPHGWIREPYLPDLLAGLNLGVPGLGLIALTLAAGYAITTLLTPRSAAPPAPSPAPFVVQPSGCPQPAAHPLLPLALALALVPLLMWIFSCLSTPIFNERYYFPAGLAWPILIAAVAARLDHAAAALARPLARQLPRLLQLLALLFLLTYFLNYTLNVPDPTLPTLVNPPDTFVDAAGITHSIANLPIVVENPQTYLPRYYYAAQGTTPQRNVCLLDWPSAIDPEAARSAANNQQIAAALKRQYPAFTIEDSAAFLASHNEFLLLPDDDLRWHARHILNNPAYRTAPLTAPNGQLFLYVRRLRALPQ